MVNNLRELYDFLLLQEELHGNIHLNNTFILYYNNDIYDDIVTFYNKCIEDKNKIIDLLPNGFKLDDFNYADINLSFKIKQING